jgi:hypothetical protein
MLQKLIFDVADVKFMLIFDVASADPTVQTSGR